MVVYSRVEREDPFAHTHTHTRAHTHAPPCLTLSCAMAGLTRCTGGAECPLKIPEHPLAGEEFLIGCSACRNKNMLRYVV